MKQDVMDQTPKNDVLFIIGNFDAKIEDGFYWKVLENMD